MRRSWLLALLVGLVACETAFAGQPDIPAYMKNAPGASIHGVITYATKPQFRVLSWSRLNSGRSTGRHRWNKQNLGAFTEEVAAGQTGDWHWKVLAGPPVFASWKNWTALAKVRRYRTSEDLSHPAVDWSQAMSRLQHLAGYLLGQAPLPLKATVYLVPRGSAGDLRETESNPDFVPLSFVFWYPTERQGSSGPLHQRQFAAMVHAASDVFYEFQHVELAAGVSFAPAARKSSLTANVIKDEANSVCWRISSEIVLLAGTHSRIRYRNLQVKPGTPAFHKKYGSHPNYRNAIPWASALVAMNLRTYLKEKNLPETFSVDDHAADNAVLQFCRVLTRHAWDIRNKSIRASQIDAPPFFAAKSATNTQGI